MTKPGEISGSADDAVRGLLTKSLQYVRTAFLVAAYTPMSETTFRPGGRHRGDEVAVALPLKYGKRRGNTVQHAPEVDVDHRRPTLDVEV